MSPCAKRCDRQPKLFRNLTLGQRPATARTRQCLVINGRVHGVVLPSRAATDRYEFGTNPPAQDLKASACWYRSAAMFSSEAACDRDTVATIANALRMRPRGGGALGTGEVPCRLPTRNLRVNGAAARTVQRFSSCQPAGNSTGGHHVIADPARGAGAVKTRSADHVGGGAQRRGLDGAEHRAMLPA